MALAVVAMHSNLVDNNSLINPLFCRIAVPYFFIASGFFMYEKCLVDTDAAVKKYNMRLMLPYIAFSLIWIIQYIIDGIIERTHVFKLLLSILQNILFFPRGALWYVWACIVALLLLKPFIKRRILPYAVCLGLLLYCVGLLANNYYFITDSIPVLKKIVDYYLVIFLTSNNGVFIGFIYIAIGMFIKQYYSKVTLSVVSIIAFVSFIVYYAEIIYVKSRNLISPIGDGAFYLSQIVFIPSLFLITTKISCNKIKRKFLDYAKNLSVGIYFLHVPLLWCITRFAKYCMPRIPILSNFAFMFDYGVVKFCSVVLISCTICIISYENNWKLVKYLK